MYFLSNKYIPFPVKANLFFLSFYFFILTHSFGSLRLYVFFPATIYEEFVIDVRDVVSSIPDLGNIVGWGFSSDQVTGTVFSHLIMPFLPNSEFV